MDTHRKFLEFNGKNIFFQNVDGEFWIAIKPICESLDLEYTRQFKNIKDDEILSQLLAEQPMVGADNRIRKMVSLPEKYIYGWLFSIRSKAPQLKEYKLTCYDVLYSYFHGYITGRKDLLQNKCIVETEISNIEEKLFDNADFNKYKELQKRNTDINKELRKNDRKVIEENMNLFNYLN